MKKLYNLFTVKSLFVALFCMATSVNMAMAQDKPKVNASLSLVSDYVWRGLYQNSGVSFQPSLGVSYMDFTLGAWGSQSTSFSSGAQEVDLNHDYTVGPMLFRVTDYWWNGIQSKYGNHAPTHYFEGTIGYTTPTANPFAITWSTMFAGADKKEDNKQAYSTYINMAYTHNISDDLSITSSIGITPWKGLYSANHAAITDIAVLATKVFTVNNNLSLPVFVEALYSPINEKAYLLGGVSLSL